MKFLNLLKLIGSNNIDGIRAPCNFSECVFRLLFLPRYIDSSPSVLSIFLGSKTLMNSTSSDVKEPII